MKKLKLARLLAAFLSILPSSNRICDRSGAIKNPFFIISAGRSGSTLLNRMLNEHERLFLPSEQYFLGPSILKYKLYRSIIWRDLVKIIVGELAKPLQSHTWEISEDTVYQKLINIPKSKRSLQLIIDTIFTEYGVQQQKTSFRWGDSTTLNTHYIKEISSLFPNSPFIFLIRDGREVVSSYYKGGKNHFEELADPSRAAAHWNRSVLTYDYLNKCGCRVYLLKYEDLVDNPDEILQEICYILGVSYTSTMLDYYKNIPDLDFHKEEYHQKIKSPIFKPESKWDSTFGNEEKSVILPIISQNLRRFGYI